MSIDRLPAIPLIASDPYLSIWMPADTMTRTDSAHWCGKVKPIRGEITVDGVPFRFLGTGSAKEAKLTALTVSPLTTSFVSEADGIELEASFTTPALPDDLDILSMPVTLLRFIARPKDGKAHDVSVSFFLSDRLCYNEEITPEMTGAQFVMDGLNVAWRGQLDQKPLCHTGDHFSIDWGYLYLASKAGVQPLNNGLSLDWSGRVDAETEVRAVVAYDDIASINYFGDLCKAWYRRNGAQVTDAIRFAANRFDELLSRAAEWDERVQNDALVIGEDYRQLVCASFRHTFAAHKLIATPKGDMVLLSKENDSNGCIGTVDVSYPSIPLFLKYRPELVNALCLPVLEFASMPVWPYDFAPHDVGRYPYATGQVYGAKINTNGGYTHPPYYLYPAGSDVFSLRGQMPVEECGNMLVMLAAAQAYGADKSLAESYRPLLDKWVKYLVEFGEDPGEQLCTDDFAGHLARNVNLAAKAMVGVACYGRLTGQPEYEQKARDMAKRFTERVGNGGDTPLTLDGNGWSMKYNLLWDKVLKLNLLPASFYEAETRSYLKRMNAYGLPLDSRADYTKSDWICWTAALAESDDVRAQLLAPIAKMLRETTTRVAFSDWYDTKTGRTVHFIARSVQGGVFAPMLTAKK